MKTLLIRLLQPWARLRSRLQTLARLWYHTRLSVGVQYLAGSTVVLGPVELHGTGCIRIAGHALLYPGLFLETEGQGRIDIGQDVVLSRGVHLSSRCAITLGNGSMVGEYTSIRDANHRFGAGLGIRHSGFSAAAIVIGENVWIGRGSVILPGVSIGASTVVAANSVVTRSLPAGVLAMGSPARVMRSLDETGS